MEIEVHSEMLKELVELARTIAQHCQQHPVLIAGLQPAKDYEFAGRIRPGMATLRLNAARELREAAVGVGRDWQISMLADILSASACLDELAPSQREPYWWCEDCLLRAKTFGFGQEEVEAAAIAKYRLMAARSCKDAESPAERDARVAEENAAIQAALDELPWPGIPVGELAARHDIPEITLRKADIPRRRAGNVILVKMDERFFMWLGQYQQKRRKKAEESEVSEQ